MEHMRAEALAYFRRLSPDQKNAARKLFLTLDTDGSGTISVEELSAFLRSKGTYNDSYQKLFKDLDADNNGFLDFNEIITFYYMIVVSPDAALSHANQSNKQSIGQGYTNPEATRFGGNEFIRQGSTNPEAGRSGANAENIKMATLGIQAIQVTCKVAEISLDIAGGACTIM